LAKPTYYLWKADYQNEKKYLDAKEKYSNLGFRVVTFKDGLKENNIHQGLKAIIQNHFPP